MNKLEMAQRFAEIFAEKVQEPHKVKSKEFIEILTETAWKLADAMQAEADKREDKSIPDVFKKDKDGNCLHTHTTFGGCECFDCGVNLKEEWQPDWSQAPAHDVVAWDIDERGQARWIASDNGYYLAPEFGYTGRWQDSLRKRHESGFKHYYGDGIECAR